MNVRNKFKTVFNKIVYIIVVAVCCIVPCFLCVSCIKGLSKYERAMQIARVRFGCKKILWIGTASYGNPITGEIKYRPEESGGGAYISDSTLSERGGYYVIGEDGNGDNVYVLVPHDKELKPVQFDWPFDYTFSEILDFLGQFGYKYADGMGDRLDEYLDDYDLYVEDTEYEIKYVLNRLGDADEMYEQLDVKLLFEYTYVVTQTPNKLSYNYYVVQEGGELKLYRKQSSVSEPEVFVYERNP